MHSTRVLREWDEALSGKNLFIDFFLLRVLQQIEQLHSASSQQFYVFLFRLGWHGIMWCTLKAEIKSCWGMGMVVAGNSDVDKLLRACLTPTPMPSGVLRRTKLNFRYQMADKPKRFLFYLVSQSKTHLSCAELKFAISTSSREKRFPWKVCLMTLWLGKRDRRASKSIMKLKQIFHIKLWEQRRFWMFVFLLSKSNGESEFACFQSTWNKKKEGKFYVRFL